MKGNVMKKNLLLLASTSFLCLGTAAGAQEQDGNFYGAIRAGINWAHDEALEGNFASKDERDLGLVLGGAIGYDFKPMRLELEFMQRRNDLDGLTVRSDGGAGAALGLGPLSGPTALVDTNVNASTIMANFIYDVPVVKGFQPYLGAGIGVAIVDLDYRLAGGQDLLRSNDAEPAFQALAGFSSQLSDHWTAEVGYRFLTTAQSRLLVADAIDAQAKYKSHSVLVGLRYAFGGPKKAQAAPAPVAAPAPPPNRAPRAENDRARVEAGNSVMIDVLANDRDPEGRLAGIATIGEAQYGKVSRDPSGAVRYTADPKYVGRDRFTYTVQDQDGSVATATVDVDVLSPEIGPFIVFFDFDSATLAPEAEKIVRDAADAFKKYGVARIEVVGHTDRSGAAKYNQGLSQRRAASVEKALAGLGVPSDSVLSAARGESDPLVQTDDGVREPQNRRVEILFPKPGS